MIMTLQRSYTPHGTFGVLRYGDLELATIERNWNNNEPNISCIPEGVYTIGLCTFHEGGYDTLEIENVDGRTVIKFHKGNFPDDVKGCVAVGTTTGVLRKAGVDRWAVLNSRQAFDQFWQAVKDNPPRTIQITSIHGTPMEVAA